MTTPIDMKAISERLEHIWRLQDECLQHDQDELDALQRNYPGVPLRQCTWCWTLKPATPEFFHRNRTDPDGLDSYCKACRNDYQTRYRQFYRNYFGVGFRRSERRYTQETLAIRRWAEAGGIPFVPSAKRSSAQGAARPSP